MGHANPSHADLRVAYRYKGIPGWQPGAPHLVEVRAGTGATGNGLPAEHRNSPESKAARFARFCAAMDDGATAREAGVAAGVAIKTAQRYNRARKALLVAAEPAPPTADGAS
jgi:hypothetical protein